MSELHRRWPVRRASDGTTEIAPAKDAAGMSVRPSLFERLALWWVVGVPMGLYLLAAALLLFRLDSHPGFVYNWEGNTAYGLFNFVDRPTLDLFHIGEGLMTDSGSSPWVVLPAWLGFIMGGVGLGAMRWPVALVAAGAVPLLWLVGKRIVGRRTALLAGLLLAMSPAFLLYARTATSVGVSLVPMLLTVYVLLRLLERPDRWVWAVALQAALLLGAYGYAPVRFLWLISVGLLLVEAALRKEHRKRLISSAVLAVIMIAGAITALDYEREHDFVTSVGYYYSGRGEQVANLLTSTESYAHAVGRSKDQLPSALELLGQVVGQNSADLANLLLDRDTQPAITDFWNPHGRLLTGLLAPFFLLGLARVVWLGRKREAYQYRLLLVCFLGFTLPMVLTSRVHIGRLIFAVPLLCLIAAFGIADCLNWTKSKNLRIADYGLRVARVGSNVRRFALGVALAGLLVGVAVSAWNDYTVQVPVTPGALITAQLAADVGKVRSGGGGVALIDVEDSRPIFETIDASQYRLGLDRYYCFNDLASGENAPCLDGDPRPTLYVGGILALMQQPERVPGYCANTYYVAPGLLDKFQATLREHPMQCPRPVKYKVLPD